MTSTKELELMLKLSLAMETLIQISAQAQASAMLIVEIADEIKRAQASAPAVDLASLRAGTVQ